jgi:transcriptional regulator with XRE-family HTH domain
MRATLWQWFDRQKRDKMRDDQPNQPDRDGDMFFGLWLRHRRRELDLTQNQLAHQVGCVADTVRKLEAGMRRPSRAMAERLALCLSIPVAEHDSFLAAARTGRALLNREVLTRTAPTTVAPASEPTSSTTRPRTSRLPASMSSFIGREWEVATVRARLQTPEVRLVTLTGAGGIGKTRLALQVAGELHDIAAHGVWFVDLAPIRDPALVIPTIAHTLGVREQPGMSPTEALCAGLHEQGLVLLLDNFEQVVEAAPKLAQLLAGVPGMTLLVTSREALRLSGEHVVVVAPLAVPDPTVALAAEQLAQYAAVQLFVARAQAAADQFRLTDINAP